MGEECNRKSCDRSARKLRKKKEKLLVKVETSDSKTDEDQASRIEDDIKYNVEKKREANGIGKEQEVNLMNPLEEEKQEESNKEKSDSRKSKNKQHLLEEAAKAFQRGICYLSRIPPHMDPVKLRQILSQYGEIQRIYLAPEDPATRVPRKRENRKRDGGFQEQGFSEGWVEFTKKSVAKRIANMLNGEQIGGRKRSSFYYDLWNIKYLSKFKWDDLTAEIAYKNAIREQKLALEISAAKRERDFYLSKVDKSRALSSIEERLKKKQKVQQQSQTHSEIPGSEQAVKVIRQFPQKQPFADKAAPSKPLLSKDILAGVFGGS